MAEDPVPHLRTKYVFVDTQAFRRARFDWNGRSLFKLTEFAEHGHLQLLVTDVTVREVKSQILELIAEASKSLEKHSGILGQLGASQAAKALKDETSATIALEAAFDQFLKRAKAIHVPLTSDIKGVVDDYFAKRPPFSKKKKAEFPDAISIASVRLWCEQKHETAYVVSEDSDLQACCSESGPLFHANSIAEIISRATVSRELHDALVQALRNSDGLREGLAEKIKDVEVDIGRRHESIARSFSITAAKIDRVDSVEIFSVNVLEQQQEEFQCEVEVEAGVSLDIDVSVEGYGYGPDDYEPPHGFSVHQSRTEIFYAEVVVRFEAKTGALEIDSIYVGAQAVSVGTDDVDALY